MKLMIMIHLKKYNENQYLISTDAGQYVLDNNNLESIIDEELPYYSTPTSFMGEKSSFEFLAQADKILWQSTNFTGFDNAGTFIINKNDLQKLIILPRPVSY